MTEDPYKAPQAELEPTPSSEGEIILREPRTVAVGRGLAWLSEAFNLFRKYPWQWVSTGMTFFGLSMLASFIPIAGGVVYTILSSIIFGGVMMGCAAQEMGEDYSTNYLFVAFAKPQKLIILAIIYLVVAYTIFLVVLGPLGKSILIGGIDPQLIESQLDQYATPILIATALMIPLIMAMWFSAPLVVLHDVPVGTAMRLSFSACLRNVLPMVVFSFVLGVLFLIGTMPLFLGLLIVYPLMIIATYTGYRDIFTHEETGSR